MSLAISPASGRTLLEQYSLRDNTWFSALLLVNYKSPSALSILFFDWFLNRSRKCQLPGVESLQNRLLWKERTFTEKNLENIVLGKVSLYIYVSGKYLRLNDE